MRIRMIGGWCALALMAGVALGDVRQSWVATYDGPNQGEDVFDDVLFDGDGNIIIPAWTVNPQTGYDFLLVKYNPSGKLLWAATWDGPDHSEDQSFTGAVDANGDIYMVGVSTSATTGRDIVTVKFSGDGNLLWENRFDGPAHGEDGVYGYRMIGLDAAGDVYVSGYTELVGGGFAAIAIKYASNGDEVWERLYEAPNAGCPYAYGYAMAVTPAGDVYLAGDFWGNDCTGSDIGLVVYDTDGNELWTARYDGPLHGYDGTYGIAVDADGAAYIAGISDSVGGFEATLAKLDSNGVVWAQRFGGSAGYHYGFGVALDAQKNAYMCGAYMTGGGEYELYVLKVTAAGSLAWVGTHRTEWFAEDWGNDVKIGPDGNVYVVGNQWNGFNAGDDAVALKFDTNGNELWYQVYNGPASGPDANFAVSFDSNGNVYTTGYTLGTAHSADGLLIKYLEAPCTGNEAIDSANCKQRGSSHLLVVKVSGGLPGDPVTVQLSSGETGSALVKDTGKAKIKISNVDTGPGTATATWGCGTTAAAAYTCQ